jgi:dTDP-glucose 4,6-dehydratase
VYNIGSGTELTNIDVTERIIEMVGGSEDQIEFVEDRLGHDQRYSLDATKLRSLGWEPERSFESGLKETVNHYL